MRLINIIFIITLLFAQGCIKDETNTNYAKLDLPYINNPDKDPLLFIERHEYKVQFGGVLEITPALEYSNPDDLSYEWKVGDKTISTEKNLKWTCDIKERESGAFIVTRKSAGNSEYFFFNVNIDQPFERGWNIAVNKGGNISYSFLQETVAAIYTYKQYPDVLATGKSAEGWIKSMEYWSNEQGNVKGHMLHLDSNPDDCLNFEELSMAPTVSLKQEFVSENLPAVPLKDAMYCGYVSYLTDIKGNVYYRKSQKGYYTGRFSNIPLQYEGKPLVVSHMVSMAPYKCGMGLLFDSQNGRFLIAVTDFGNSANNIAGEIIEFPTGSGLNDLKGEEIVYSRIIKPQYSYQTDYILFFVSKNSRGEYKASEYNVYVEGGALQQAEKVYAMVPFKDFGPGSCITVLDNPGDGQGYVYYSSSAAPEKLYSCRRSSSGLSSYKEYHTFGGKILSLNHGVISRTTKTIGLTTDDGVFTLLELRPSMDSYVAPSEGKANSLSYRWEGINGVLDAKFRYGSVGLY